MSTAFIVMNKCILKRYTVKSIPPPCACQIQSSKISDLGLLITFWPSCLPWELQRWRELATLLPPLAGESSLAHMCQIQKCVVLPCVSSDKGRGVGGYGRCSRAVAKAASRAQVGAPFEGLKCICAAENSCECGLVRENCKQ